MKGTRIEILKDGVWTKVRLKDSRSVKYNAVINKIAGTDTRQLSATNTFSLPGTRDNIQALGINIFNTRDNAKALNRKYEAKYYIDDILIQTGFLLINNTLGGTIQVNFIDEALDIVSKWGTITYKDLLLSTVLDIPDDYLNAIQNMRDYEFPVNQVLNKLGNVGARGYGLCLFPNNLNSIGDLFQKNAAGIRVDDAFNPYQARPLYNVKSLYDLATEAWGYTAIYDSSVDWAGTVEKTYMVNEAQDGKEEGDGGITPITHPSIALNSWYYAVGVPWADFETRNMFIYPSSVSLKPSEVANWETNSYITNEQSNLSYMTQNSLFTPNVSHGNTGS